MEKKTIWHPMSEKPQKRGLICNKAGAGVEFIPGCNWGSLGWKEWVYLDAVVNSLDKTSKALDVAHNALLYYQDKDYETDCTAADDALTKIEEIMKGDK